MNKSCNSISRKMRDCFSTCRSSLSSWPLGAWYRFLTLVLLGMSSVAYGVTITSLKGNVFVILPQGKVQEAHYGQKLPDMTEIMTDETSQVAWRDEAGNFYQLAASGHIRFLNQIIELQQGNLWLKVTQPTSASVQTANSVVDFKKADGIISYDGESSRTQVLATQGQFVLSNILVPEAQEVIGAGQFSFLEPSYENGMPRVATNVGKNSYKKMTQLFIGHHEDGLERNKRLPASVEAMVFEDQVRPSDLPSPQEQSKNEQKAKDRTANLAQSSLKMAAKIGATVAPASSSSTAPVPVDLARQATLVDQSSSPAAATSPKAQVRGGIEVKTYGQIETPAATDHQTVQVEKTNAPQLGLKQNKQGPATSSFSSSSSSSSSSSGKSAAQAKEAKPQVTPGKIVYYLPDYEQEQQVQREKVAAFYGRQVALMAATPTPKKFAPDYTSPSNTTVKILGGKQKLAQTKQETAQEAAPQRKIAAEESGAPVAVANEGPIQKGNQTNQSGQVGQKNQIKAANPAAQVNDDENVASSASSQRGPASVENMPLEKITLKQFTQKMRLDNEADQLVNELQSYRIDRRGR